MAKVKKYLVCKTVDAEAATLGSGVEGYSVRNPEGYVSWVPKEMFESSHLPVECGTYEDAISEIKGVFDWAIKDMRDHDPADVNADKEHGE